VGKFRERKIGGEGKERPGETKSKNGGSGKGNSQGHTKHAELQAGRTHEKGWLQLGRGTIFNKTGLPCNKRIQRLHRRGVNFKGREG